MKMYRNGLNQAAEEPREEMGSESDGGLFQVEFLSLFHLENTFISIAEEE